MRGDYESIRWFGFSVRYDYELAGERPARAKSDCEQGTFISFLNEIRVRDRLEDIL